MINNKPYPYYNRNKHLNFRQYLEQAKNDYKDQICFSYKKDGNLIKKSYIQVNDEIRYFATNMIESKYSKSRIGVIGENSYEWILTYLGVVTSDNIIVPIDKELTIENIIGILKNTQTEILFYSETYKDYIGNIKKEIPKIKLFDMNQEMSKFIENGKEIYDNKSEIYNNTNINPDDVAAIIYTSGTTGIAKGVKLTHQNICLDCYGAMQILQLKNNSILVLPLHHTYSFTGAVLCCIGWGVEVYINSSLKKLQDELIEQKPSLLLVVPLMIESFHKKIWTKAKSEKKDKLLKVMMYISNMLYNCGIDVRRKIFKNILNNFGGNLEMMISGGSMLDERYVKEFRSFGIQIVQGYGITECAPMLAVTRNHQYKDKSVGLKLPNVDIKINKYNNSNEGEILAKGEMVMQGYYNDFELTKQSFDEDGYFKTGDVGYIDEDDFIYITGRVKNMIILNNGKNVYPEELEMELLRNDKIKEVVIYEEDKAIVAEIFPDINKLNQNKVEDKEEYFNKYMQIFNKNQPFYKNISKIIVRNQEFPKTTTLKIKRN